MLLLFGGFVVGLLKSGGVCEAFFVVFGAVQSRYVCRVGVSTKDSVFPAFFTVPPFDQIDEVMRLCSPSVGCPTLVNRGQFMNSAGFVVSAEHHA